MPEIITTYGLTTIVIVLLVVIPTLIRFLSWCKETWQKREDFKEESIKKGIAIEQKKEAEEIYKEETEKRIKALENAVLQLTKLQAEQKKAIDLLIESDQLDIKSWIKTQHETWMPRQCIDSQTLDLLTQRFAIYEKEHGNGWAKKMVDELKALPVVTVIPITQPHEQE